MKEKTLIAVGVLISLIALSLPSMQTNEASVKTDSEVIKQFQMLQVLPNQSLPAGICPCGENCECRTEKVCDCQNAEAVVLNDPLRESDIQPPVTNGKFQLVNVFQQTPASPGAGIATNDGPPKPQPPAPAPQPEQAPKVIPQGAVACATCASGYYYPNQNYQQVSYGGPFRNRRFRPLARILPRNWGGRGSGGGCSSCQ